jgi:hypothetical protein
MLENHVTWTVTLWSDYLRRFQGNSCRIAEFSAAEAVNMTSGLSTLGTAARTIVRREQIMRRERLCGETRCNVDEPRADFLLQLEYDNHHDISARSSTIMVPVNIAEAP